MEIYSQRKSTIFCIYNTGWTNRERADKRGKKKKGKGGEGRGQALKLSGSFGEKKLMPNKSKYHRTAIQGRKKRP